MVDETVMLLSYWSYKVKPLNHVASEQLWTCQWFKWSFFCFSWKFFHFNKQYLIKIVMNKIVYLSMPLNHDNFVIQMFSTINVETTFEILAWGWHQKQFWNCLVQFTILFGIMICNPVVVFLDSHYYSMINFTYCVCQNALPNMIHLFFDFLTIFFFFNKSLCAKKYKKRPCQKEARKFHGGSYPILKKGLLFLINCLPC